MQWRVKKMKMKILYGKDVSRPHECNAERMGKGEIIMYN